MCFHCFLIEDEPLAVQLLEAYIEHTPFLKMARKITDLENAIEMISEQMPDLLFLDLNTHGVNKVVIDDVIRNKNGMQIILTTAYPKKRAEQMLQINLEGVGHLHKPFTYEDFLEEVERMLG